jgi:RNA polymerase sigma-54 factor
VSDHLHDLAAGRYHRIARALRITEAEVLAAQGFIRRFLRPRPAVDFVTRAPGLTHGSALADVVIRSSAGGELEVEVPESRWRELRVSRRYEELAAEYAALGPDGCGSQPAAALTAAERSHIEAYLEQARAFLQQLRQRGETLRRVATSLVESQRLFVLKGPVFLRPLTLAQVAEDLGFHESTVSRATSNKCAQLPCGKIIPLRQFFQPARRAHELLRQLVAAEEHPLCDDALARALAAHGVDVARRTVAKYRGELGIPPYHVRAALARSTA